MTEATRALLDQLMGPNRNSRMGDDEDKRVHWSDDNICTWFLCGFCPHDLFKNTREDLGACPELHSPILKEEFNRQKDRVKNRYFHKYLQKLETMRQKGDARIARARDRLRKEANPNASFTLMINHKKKINSLKDEIDSLEAECEILGEEGKVTEAQETMSKHDLLVKQLSNLEETAKQQAKTQEADIKPLTVCETCGGFIVDDDSSSRRYQSHQVGRMHAGYTKIREKIDELDRMLAGYVPSPSSSRSRSRRRSSSRSRRRKSRSHSRSRSRDRGRRRRRRR